MLGSMMTRLLLPLTLAALLAAPLWAKPFQAKTDLKRCLVGNQAGLLKVLHPDRKVAYTRGIDDRSLARMSEADREALLTPLGIDRSNLAAVSTQLMRDYAKLPRKEAIALLGAMAGSPALDAPTLAKIESFLVGIMRKSPDVMARRQAILALAVLPEVRPETVAQVVAHYEKCQNLWETFPIQQFFEYHAAHVRSADDFARTRARLAAVRSLYTPMVLNYLDS